MSDSQSGPTSIRPSGPRRWTRRLGSAASGTSPSYRRPVERP
jgi:hypothetical protein